MHEHATQSRMHAHHSVKRFLFIISDTGGGHRASANAVQDALHRLYGVNVAVEIVDIFTEMDRWPFSHFPDWYPHAVSMNAIPWAVAYHLSNRVRLMKTMSRIVWPYARKALCAVLRQHPADVIVSFHPIPCYSLQMATRYLGWNTPIATVAVDLVTAHASWFVPGSQMYLVPTEAAKERAIRFGLPGALVTVTGMPTRHSFTEAMHLSRSAARTLLHIPQDVPVVLVVGGGEGMGPLGHVVKALAHQQISAHIIAIAGRNQSLYEELTSTDYPIPIHVKGFVDNMHVWMRAADILVTKAGPNTLSEAFISELPIVMYTALPGQEEGNVTHVVSNGAGVWTPHPSLTARTVKYLVQHPEARQRMAEKSRALARPYASQQIARNLWALIAPLSAKNIPDLQQVYSDAHPTQPI